MEFKKDTIDKLKYYVYALAKPEDGQEKIFYIGKGKGNRVFNHFREANKLKEMKELQTKKHKNILEGNVKAYILRHGLTEKESFEYETVLIDINNMFGNKLANIVDGHKNSLGNTVKILETTELDGVYSELTGLNKFASDNKLNITVIKLNHMETYQSLLGKDLSWGIEMLWRTTEETIENSDLILGVNNQKVFGVFKYVKGSIREYKHSDAKSRRELEDHIKKYEKQGYYRPDLIKSLDDKSSDGRKHFFVDTVLRPSIGSLDVKEIDHPLKELLRNEVLNRYLEDEKIKGQNPIMKFWGRY